MKSIIGLLIVGLLSACALAPVAPTPLTPTEAVCKLANDEVERTEVSANTAEDKHFEMQVEACGLIENTGMGYAIFHINGYDVPGHIYLGHMKRMALYVQEGGRWVHVEEGTLVFLPPPNAAPPKPKRSGIEL